MSYSLTQEEIHQLNQEPGDIIDILQEIPDGETLDNLKKLIDTHSAETISTLLKNITTHHEVNTINPHNNKFSTVSKNELYRRRYKQLLLQKRK